MGEFEAGERSRIRRSGHAEGGASAAAKSAGRRHQNGRLNPSCGPAGGSPFPALRPSKEGQE